MLPTCFTCVPVELSVTFEDTDERRLLVKFPGSEDTPAAFIPKVGRGEMTIRGASSTVSSPASSLSLACPFLSFACKLWNLFRTLLLRFGSEPSSCLLSLYPSTWSRRLVSLAKLLAFASLIEGELGGRPGISRS